MTTACPVCGRESTPLHVVTGRFSGRVFHLRRCGGCRFAFVADPWTDYDRIYDDDYYTGRGADPLVNYVDELDHPDTTVRRYEWRGIVARVRDLTDVDSDTTWLDYGCGVGGLVHHLHGHGMEHAVGFERGWAVPLLRRRGMPFVTDDELPAWAGRCDVVTAIEVLEHAVDPVAELRRMRTLLRPGGLLFLTTGNAQPYRHRLATWRYVVPEVHVSFFEPETLGQALSRAGLAPTYPGYGPGWTDIIRFKILKNLRRKRRAWPERLVPWEATARLLDRRLGISAHPVGWARADEREQPDDPPSRARRFVGW